MNTVPPGHLLTAAVNAMQYGLVQAQRLALKLAHDGRLPGQQRRGLLLLRLPWAHQALCLGRSQLHLPLAASSDASPTAAAEPVRVGGLRAASLAGQLTVHHPRGPGEWLSVRRAFGGLLRDRGGGERGIG